MPGATVMGRPKKGSAKKATPRPPDDRVAIIHLKGTPDYAEWLDGVHRKTDIPKATIVRRALELWAEKNGHSAPPEL